MAGTHLAAGYKRVKVQTGSRVRDMPLSFDVTITAVNPSGVVRESIWREESRSQVDEV